MFVLDFKTVERPYHHVASALTTGLAEILELALAAARTESDRFRVGLAPFGWPTSLAQRVNVQPGPVRAQREGILIAFTWHAVAGASLFPRMDADLEVAPIGRDRTILNLRGRLTIASELIGGGTEEFLILRLAESMNRAFLVGVCASLESEARAIPDPVS